MNTALVLTLIGEDRPGVVEQISQRITACEGRWLKSEFNGLDGKFAGFVQVEVPTANAQALTTELRALDGPALRLLVAEGRAAPSGTRYPLTIRFVGLDRRNVVTEISAVLGRHGVTIDSLNSRCFPAPMSGELLFEAEFQVRAPLSVSSDRLCEALEALTPELMVDLEPQSACAV